MLKILAGSEKGRPLKTVSSAQVRPILARIKKSLFDILRPRLGGSNFLDLYAGTGSVGIEALSQGAARATFVEQDAPCLRFLKDNLDLLKLTDRATAIRSSATGDLSGVPRPYDIIFMGPPYKDAEKKALALVTPTLENIYKYKLLAPG